MKKELILHVGAHKTATTSIQNTLYNKKNLEIFEKYNINFIKNWDSNNGRLISSAFCDDTEKYHFNIKKGYSKKEIKRFNKNTKKELIKELKEKERLIVTGESISALSSENLLNLKSFIFKKINNKVNIKIIYFVRNPIDFSSSMYQTIVRGGVDISDRRIKKEVKGIYKNRILKFIEIFGRKNVYVYSFEDACSFKNGPAGYFFNILGIPKSELDNLEYDRKNERLCHKAIEIAEFINEKEPKIIDNKLNPKRTASDINPLRFIKGSKFSLDNYILKDILKSVKEDLKWLEIEYNINYLDISKKLNVEMPEIEYDETSVIKSFIISTELIRKNLISYFLNENKKLAEILIKVEKKLVMKDTILSNNKKNEIVKLNKMKEESYKTGLFKISRIKDNIFEIKFEENNDIADIYRGIALYLEKLGEIEQAYIYMNNAKEYRASGVQINKRIIEYKTILNICN